MSNTVRVRAGKFNWCDMSEVSTIADFYLDDSAPLLNGEKLSGSYDFGEGDCVSDADDMTVLDVALHCQEYYKRIISSKKKRLDALVEYLKTTAVQDDIDFFDKKLKKIESRISELKKQKQRYEDCLEQLRGVQA